MPALAALTKVDPAKPKKWVAWIAPPFVPYAPALQQHGVNIDRLLMIHPTAGNKSRLWAIEQAVRSGSSAGVLAWVAAAEDVMLRRLQLAAEDQGCWVLLFRPASARLAALAGRVANPFVASAVACATRLAWRSSNAEAGGRASSMYAGFALDADGFSARASWLVSVMPRVRNLSSCSRRAAVEAPRAPVRRPVPSKPQLWIAVCLPSLAFECLCRRRYASDPP